MGIEKTMIYPKNVVTIVTQIFQNFEVTMESACGRNPF